MDGHPHGVADRPHGFHHRRLEANPIPAGAANLTMEVVAHQFNFEFRYPGSRGRVLPAGEMHLPVGKSVKILVSSADVIHQFWVPDYRLKIGAVPGLVTDLNLTPTRPGRSNISCSEYCGSNHSTMQAKSVVESPDDFNKWLTAQKAQAARLRGTSRSRAATRRPARRPSIEVLGVSRDRAVHQKIVGPGLTSSPTTPPIRNWSTTKSRRRPTSPKSSKRAYRPDRCDAERADQRLEQPTSPISSPTGQPEVKRIEELRCTSHAHPP